MLLAFLALQGGGLLAEQYELTTSSEVVDGATYTDVNAQLPAIKLLFLISLLAAVLLIINVAAGLAAAGDRRRPVGPGSGVAGAAYPAFVQRFQVQPAESTPEQPFIERNIAATRTAMNLDNVEVVPYQLDTLDPQELELVHAHVAERPPHGHRGDGTDVPEAEALPGYYQLSQLDLDRYEIDGRCSRP